MRSGHLVGLTAASLLLCIAAPRAAAQNQALEIINVAPGVYAAIFAEYRMDPIEGNSLIVVGGDSVMVLDSGRTPDAARAMIAEIRKITPLPVRQVINSHWHDDHIFGNQAYRDAFPGVEFIAHRHTRTDMLERSIPSLVDYGPEYWTKMAERFEAQLGKGTRQDGSPLTEDQKQRLRDQARTVREFLPKVDSLRVVLPTIVVDDDLTIYQGEREIRIMHLGSGNTAGDLVVYLPGEAVVATGDVLVHPVPFAYGSDVGSWIEVLKSLRQIEAKVIVPGHGPLMRDKAYVELLIELFESLLTQVRAAVKAGLSLDEARKTIDLKTFRDRLAGDDVFRRNMFADSIVREAVERTYKAVK